MGNKLYEMFNVRELNDAGLLQLPDDKLTGLMEVAIQGGRQIVIQGVVKTPTGREVIIQLEDSEGLKGPKATEYVGLVKDVCMIDIGVSVVPAAFIVNAAQEAKKKGLGIRLLGRADEEHNGESCFCVQCYQFGEAGGQFPQDFWMNRISDSADMNEALMEVMDRRS